MELENKVGHGFSFLYAVVQPETFVGYYLNV